MNFKLVLFSILIFLCLFLSINFSNLYAVSKSTTIIENPNLCFHDSLLTTQKTVKHVTNYSINNFIKLVFILFLFALVVIFLLKYRKECKKNVNENTRLKKAYASLENQLMLSQNKIDELENNNIESNEKENARKKFFSIIAHDLRNPLSILVLTTEFMIESFEDYSMEEIKKYVETIHTSSRGLSDLLENLLKWSQNQKSMSYNPSSINLNQIANNCINLLKTSLDRKHLTVNNLISPKLIAFADYNMIETTLRNLLNNAIKFTPENGKIEFYGKEIEGGKLQINVCDNGVGIHPEVQKHIFNPDVISTKKGTNNEKGSGLGLLLCKEFIERNEGKIWVESKLGKGSCFNFTLTQDFAITDFYNNK